MAIDKLEIEILADGTIKCESGKVSAQNHQSAEAFLKYVAELAGGKTTRKRRGHVHGGVAHTHDEEEEHHH